MKRTIAGISLAVAIGLTGVAGAEDMSDPNQELEAVKDLIWKKELEIYSGRGNGDMRPYFENTATGYSAWPPHTAVPNSAEDIKAAIDTMKGLDQEKLAMEFVSFTLNGTTAIIYYQTHMTQAADGRAVDARYEVTHTWTYEDGAWKVLGGMARSRPDRG